MALRPYADLERTIEAAIAAAPPAKEVDISPLLTPEDIRAHIVSLIPPEEMPEGLQIIVKPEDMLERTQRKLVLERHVDFFGVVSADVRQQLRGKIIVLCGREVSIVDTLEQAENESHMRFPGRGARIIGGPPLQDMTLAQLEGRDDTPVQQ